MDKGEVINEKEYVDEILVFALKTFKRLYLNKQIKSDENFSITHNINFDENFYPIFSTPREQEISVALLHSTNYSSIVYEQTSLDEYDMEVFSFDPIFVDSVTKIINNGPVFNFYSVGGYYNFPKGCSFNAFLLNDPLCQGNIVNGRFTASISPLYFDRKSLKGFYKILIGFKFDNFQLNNIAPALFNNFLKDLINDFESQINKSQELIKPVNIEEMVFSNASEAINFFEKTTNNICIKRVKIAKEPFQFEPNIQPMPKTDEKLKPEESNYLFKYVDSGNNCKGKTAVCYKPTNTRYIFQSDIRKTIFEYLLKNNNKKIPAAEIITKFEITTPGPYKTLKTYTSECNTVIRKLHKISGRKQFITWNINDIEIKIPE